MQALRTSGPSWNARHSRRGPAAASFLIPRLDATHSRAIIRSRDSLGVQCPISPATRDPLSYHAIGPRLAHLVSPGAPYARLARARSSSRPSVTAHLRELTREPRDTLFPWDKPTAPSWVSRSVTRRRRHVESARIDVAQGHERARQRIREEHSVPNTRRSSLAPLLSPRVLVLVPLSRAVDCCLETLGVRNTLVPPPTIPRSSP